MKKTIYTIIALLLGAVSIQAQADYMPQVSVEKTTIQREGDLVQIAMEVVLDRLNIRSNDMLVLTPVIRSNEGDYQKELKPVTITGRGREVLTKRGLALGNIIPQEYLKDGNRFRRKNNSIQTLHYTASLPFEEWMRNARFGIDGRVEGCADCLRELPSRDLISRIFNEPYKPNFGLTYIVPEAESVKARSDKYSASFNFEVGKAVLLRDYKNNASEFDKVDGVLREVMSNKDLTVTDLKVEGYASPEGKFESNRTLAGKRANAFADYLIANHGLEQDQIKVTGIGEDWMGLKKAIAESSLANKSDILKIIETVSSADARDAKIKALDKSQTYNNLLNNFYPALRRTDYTIAYHVRAFSVEEAREQIKKNPKLLSLNEMYFVAQSYPAESKDFKEVFDIAVRMFPDQPVAIVNASAVDIEQGAYQQAIDRMLKIKNDKRVWNNLGIAYAQLKQYDTARQYFQRAIQAGDLKASDNLTMLERAISEQ